MNYEYFLYKIRKSVYKWWCIVYKPVYKLTHHGYWPNEKNPYMVYPDVDKETMQPINTPQNNDTPMTEGSTNETQQSTQASDVAHQSAPVAETAQPVSESIPQTENTMDEIDTSGMDEEALRRANEIMERLAREASEDEAKKQDEIRKAREKASEQEMLASIMNANKVDISGFIEEGRSKQKNN